MNEPDLWESSRETSVSFLRTEAELGLTFCDTALGAAGDADKVQRNTANARKAYDALLRFLPRCVLTSTEADEMRDKVAHLKASLITLGEPL